MTQDAEVYSTPPFSEYIREEGPGMSGTPQTVSVNVASEGEKVKNDG